MHEYISPGLADDFPSSDTSIYIPCDCEGNHTTPNGGPPRSIVLYIPLTHSNLKQTSSSSSSANGNGANGKTTGGASGGNANANQHHPFPMRPHYGVNNVNNPSSNNNNNPSVDVEALLKVLICLKFNPN